MEADMEELYALCEKAGLQPPIIRNKMFETVIEIPDHDCGPDHYCRCDPCQDTAILDAIGWVREKLWSKEDTDDKAYAQGYNEGYEAGVKATLELHDIREDC